MYSKISIHNWKKFIQKNNSELLTIVIAISKANNGNSDNDNNNKKI